MKKIKDMYSKEFLLSVLKLALPIAMQSMFQNLLNIVDTLMISSLGEKYTASVGVSNELFFLFVLFVAGLAFGSAIFISQFWGAKDILKIKKTMGFTIFLSFIASIIAFCVAQFFGKEFINFYNKDEQVIELGKDYIHIVSYSYFLAVVGFTFGTSFRSMNEVKLPLISSAISLSINTFLNYCLIFGNLGFPKMGVEGAAIATVISRMVDATIMICFVLTFKPLRGNNIEYLHFFDLEFMKKYVKVILPVLLNDFFWGIGVSAYSFIFSRMGTSIFAGYQSFKPFADMSFVIFWALGSACAVMVGNKLGQGITDDAYQYAKKFLIGSPIIALVVSCIMIPASPFIPYLFNFQDETRHYITTFIIIFCVFLPIKCSNMNLAMGILRAGGDTMIVLVWETIALWIFGAGSGMFVAFVLHGSPMWVYIAVQGEEIVKMVAFFYRFLSKKWMQNLTTF